MVDKIATKKSTFQINCFIKNVRVCKFQETALFHRKEDRIRFCEIWFRLCLRKRQIINEKTVNNYNQEPRSYFR